MMNENYKKQAENCVKGAVLQHQKERFEKCHHDPDMFYSTLNDGDYYGRVVQAGCEYELGYRKCSCKKVLSGEITSPEQCECSKESILYILNQLMPQTQVKVEILETILRGGTCCRFKITVE